MLAVAEVNSPMIRTFCLILTAALPIAPARGAEPSVVRFATFNASLNRAEAGALVRDLSDPDDPQVGRVAEIIRRVAPDVLLVNEFDHDLDGRAIDLFRRNYLEMPRDGLAPITYPYAYTAPPNTGVASGVDLDGDGRVAAEPGSRGYGNDAFGFGLFPGQYGMVVFSKYPIEAGAVRRFGQVLWRDQPGALLPSKPDGSPWYGPEALAVFRLSSKDHWDVPIRIGPRTIHVLASHPTPPAFDGPEDRNGRRNHDEIRLWADYLDGGDRSAYLRPAIEDRDPPADFVLMGDLNADPIDGGSVPGAIGQLFDHPKVDASFIPTSPGAAQAARRDGGANSDQRGQPDRDTADFDDRSAGNLRVDYVLPSRTLPVIGGGIFWPSPDDPASSLVAMEPAIASSDHRLVYLDLRIDGSE